MLQSMLLSGLLKDPVKDEWFFTDFSLDRQATSVEQSLSKPSLITDVDPNHAGVSNDSGEDENPLLHHKLKKNSKNRKKKKSKTKSSAKKTVSWGIIEELYFERDIGYSSIPGIGSHPLGMSMTKIDSASYPIPLESSIESPVKPKSKGRKKLIQKHEVPTLNELKRRDIYQHFDIHQIPSDIQIEVNADIIRIQHSRESIGCHCKQLKVDKLSVSKMKTELALQCHVIGLDKDNISSLSKSELSNHLKHINDLCSLCIDNNCECVQLGVGCISQFCECLKKIKHIKCANPNGSTIHDATEIDAIRTQTLKDIESY